MDDEDRAFIDTSAALASGPTLNVGIKGGWFREPKAVRRRAAEVIPEIPHPPGPDSAASLPWGEGEQMSSLSEGDIQLMVQVNAMCDGCCMRSRAPKPTRFRPSRGLSSATFQAGLRCAAATASKSWRQP